MRGRKHDINDKADRKPARKTHIARVLSGASCADHSIRDSSIEPIIFTAFILILSRDLHATQHCIRLADFLRQSPAADKHIRAVLDDIVGRRQLDGGFRHAVQDYLLLQPQKRKVIVQGEPIEVRVIYNFCDEDDIAALAQILRSRSDWQPSCYCSLRTFLSCVWRKRTEMTFQIQRLVG